MEGLWFKDKGLGIEGHTPRKSDQDVLFEVEGSGFMVQGLWFIQGCGILS